MAIGADGGEIINSRPHVLPQFIQRHAVVGFCELSTNFSVRVGENKITHLTFELIPYFAFGSQKATTFALKMRNYHFSIFKTRIYIPLFIFDNCVR